MNRDLQELLTFAVDEYLKVDNASRTWWERQDCNYALHAVRRLMRGESLPKELESSFNHLTRRFDLAKAKVTQ